MGSNLSNRRWVLNNYPDGMPDESHFDLQENVDLPALKDGEILVHARYLSVDPYMRGRIAPGANYAAGVVPAAAVVAAVPAAAGRRAVTPAATASRAAERMPVAATHRTVAGPTAMVHPAVPIPVPADRQGMTPVEAAAMATPVPAMVARPVAHPAADRVMAPMHAATTPTAAMPGFRTTTTASTMARFACPRIAIRARVPVSAVTTSGAATMSDVAATRRRLRRRPRQPEPQAAVFGALPLRPAASTIVRWPCRPP